MAQSVGFLISAVLMAASSSCLADEKSDDAIEIHQDYVDYRVGQELVTRYAVGPIVAKPYFWPLSGPKRVAMTRVTGMSFPKAFL
jgi:hypothetical protein